MEKTKKILKDNRGAALITIMIAVAFIAILASALLYMSYSNFKMKVVNYESKVNFYETEGNLTNITTSIRNEIANSSSPLQTLKTTVGCYEVAPGTKQYRYNPKALAMLLDDTITIGPGESPIAYTITEADGDETFVSHMTPDNDPNFLIYTKDGADGTIADATLKSNEQKIVLADVLVQHTEGENGYVNKLVTDIVFRVSSSPTSATPGGVGEFSVLMDNPINTTGNSSRITFYGNSFVGPGDYTSASPTALTLDGDSYLAQKGEYMIVYGDIVLNNQAVLHIAEGSLTVYGNIYLNGNSVLMCDGNLFMKDGCTIVNNTGKANAVIPSDLALTKQTVTAESENNVKSTLGLDDGDTDNDGIVNQILLPEMKEKMKSPGNWMTNNAPSVNLQGIEYNVFFWSADQVNNEDADGSLCFMTNANPQMQDGANRNTTFIGFENLTFSNDKNLVLTQMGSTAFNALTTPGGDDVPEIIIGDNATTGETFELSAFFNTSPSPNEAVNNLINNSVNGGGGEPIIDTAVGYENWTKE